MKKLIISLAIVFSCCSAQAATVQGDGDSNGALDVAKGGTNATTAADARTNLGVAPSAVSTVRTTAGGGSTTAPPSEVAVGDALAGKEASLGNPGTNGYVLSSTTGGTRSWIANGAGSMVYPGAGLAVSTGSAWSTSLTCPNDGDVIEWDTGTSKFICSTPTTYTAGTSISLAGDQISVTGLVIGTNVQAYDADRDDLADGSLTGSKVASATDTSVGVAELATTAEINTGTDTGRAVTPDALAGSNLGSKELGWVIKDSDVATAVADGKQAIVVPSSMDGMNLVDMTCAVSDLNSAVSGSTTVVLRRVRGATAADMTSTGVTIAYNEYSASDETVDTSNDDIATGDKLFCDVNAITSAAHKGLYCTAVFRLP